MGELTDLKKLVDDFCKEADKFIAEIKAYEEETKKRVDNIIKTLNNGKQ